MVLKWLSMKVNEGPALLDLSGAGCMVVQVLEAHEDEVWFLQFSHDGHYLASTSKDCTAIVWEVSGLYATSFDVPVLLISFFPICTTSRVWIVSSEHS
jgi:WD40 repeat protein